MRVEANPFAAQARSLPELLGFEWTEVAPCIARGHLEVHAHHLASTGYLHAATVVALADSACGFGCLQSLPVGAGGFTTIELKANFLGTERKGRVSCEAQLVHAGRTTQVWDAVVKSDTSGKTIALFRCTQMLLYRSPAAIETPTAEIGARSQA